MLRAVHGRAAGRQRVRARRALHAGVGGGGRAPAIWPLLVGHETGDRAVRIPASETEMRYMYRVLDSASQRKTWGVWERFCIIASLGNASPFDFSFHVSASMYFFFTDKLHKSAKYALKFVEHTHERKG
jgi:hypothetical protein